MQNITTNREDLSNGWHRIGRLLCSNNAAVCLDPDPIRFILPIRCHISLAYFVLCTPLSDLTVDPNTLE